MIQHGGDAVDDPFRIRRQVGGVELELGTERDRKILRGATIIAMPAPLRRLDRPLIIIAGGALALVFVGFIAGYQLAWTALAGGVLKVNRSHQVQA